MLKLKHIVKNIKLLIASGLHAVGLLSQPGRVPEKKVGTFNNHLVILDDQFMKSRSIAQVITG